MKHILILLTCIIFLGCTDAKQEKFFGLGNEHTIQLYSGGKLIGTWNSTGKVSSEKNSDGYFFKDKLTGNLIEISGDIIITTK